MSTTAPDLFRLSGPGLTLTYQLAERFALRQITAWNGVPLLHSNAAGAEGAGAVGNPFCVIIRDGPREGLYSAETFRVVASTHDERRVLVNLQHDGMPLLLTLEISVEGNVATWRGQALWNGEDAVDLDIYFPLLSRVHFQNPQQDRALVAPLSGSVLEPLGNVNYNSTYVGNLALPLFLVEGGCRGLAVLDNNQADFAADPAACVRRSYVIGNTFPFPKRPWWQTHGGDDGPFIGVCHTRRFNSATPFGGSEAYENEGTGQGTSGNSDEQLSIRKLGESADLGPIHTYAYSGTWRDGAAWLRGQRQHVPFRVSPARWYRETTFVSEENADEMVRTGRTFFDLPHVLAERQQLGSDLFHLYGFHDPELLGSRLNWNNRGDYFFAAQNLGGFEAARRGIKALHRAGGHLLYYVEGLIVWKRSQLGRANARDWALMRADGSYDEHYRGFWHMCPAQLGWQEWLARTCADIVRTTGVDGFFIDSTFATHNHRCFNPAHNHPHPDVWNWGVRQMLRRVREEVDKVNPETILFAEGCADIGREFVDGFISHGHDWSQMTLHEPLVRFIHPDIRTFESWREHPHFPAPPQRQHLWNSVHGLRIYAHNPQREEMASYSLHTRRYYNAYPEICDNNISQIAPDCEHGIAELFAGAPPVLTVGNPTDTPIIAAVRVPGPCGVLFDRVDGLRVPAANSVANIVLEPWGFRAFEVRP